MNPDTINQALEFILSSLKEGKVFAVEQTPLLLQEIIKYNIMMHSVFTLVGICIMVFAVWVAHKVSDEHDTLNRDGTYALMFLLFVFGLVVTLYNADHVVYNLVAPRVVMLDALQRYIPRIK